MKSINVKLEDDVYETFTAATKIISKSGITVQTTQIIDAVINEELTGADPKKLAQRFIKSLTEKISRINPESNEEDNEQKTYP